MAEAEQPAVVYRYTGDGTYYLNGVPARDLSEEDWALLDDAQRAAVAGSPLYESAAPAAPAPETTPPVQGGEPALPSAVEPAPSPTTTPTPHPPPPQPTPPTTAGEG